ncbi:DUF397 domain-containing protein [Streptomyces sp. NPDC021100]|uniref:DUF397 domain-containing protein n=1 Tax=Streptomyces sp. NPDC021100 TaxID=3365114 RepID=UPI00379482D9
MPEPIWFKSPLSDAGGNNCVQVCTNTPGIALREGSEPEHGIRTSPSAFRALVRGTRASATAYSA